MFITFDPVTLVLEINHKANNKMNDKNECTKMPSQCDAYTKYFTRYLHGTLLRTSKRFMASFYKQEKICTI